MLNPDFFTDPDLVAHFDAYGRLFYQGLWCVADDSGCFEMNTLLLKMKIFPGDAITPEDIEGYLATLLDLGKVIAYEVEGKRYGWLKNFHKHQTLQKPSPPTVPLPDWIEWHGEKEYGSQRHKYFYALVENGSGHDLKEEDPVQDASRTEEGHDPEASGPEEKGREGKGSKENKTTRQDSGGSPAPPPDSENETPEKSKDPGRQEPKAEAEGPKYPEGSKPYGAARYLAEKILDNNPRARVPNKDPTDQTMRAWATAMDRLHRLGPPGGEGQGYSWHEIRTLIDWCQDHDFWSANILSAAKFREQVVRLENQMRRDRQHGKLADEYRGVEEKTAEDYQRGEYAGFFQ